MSEATTGVAVAIASSGVSPKPSNVLGQTTTSAGREAVTKIGRASCRGKGENSVVAGSFKKKKEMLSFNPLIDRKKHISFFLSIIMYSRTTASLFATAQTEHRDKRKTKPGRKTLCDVTHPPL